MKRTTATSCASNGMKDSSGAMYSIDYYCPYCREPHYDFRFVSTDMVGDPGAPFEFDATCERCSKEFVVECYPDD